LTMTKMAAAMVTKLMSVLRKFPMRISTSPMDDPGREVGGARHRDEWAISIGSWPSGARSASCPSRSRAIDRRLGGSSPDVRNRYVITAAQHAVHVARYLRSPGPRLRHPASPSRAQDPATDPSSSGEPYAGQTATVLTSGAATLAGSAFIEPAWSLVRTHGGPAAREDHTWTVDRDGRFAYLFGGRDGGQVFDDLWRLDLASDKWDSCSAGSTTGGSARPQLRVGGWHGLVIFAGRWRGLLRRPVGIRSTKTGGRSCRLGVPPRSPLRFLNDRGTGWPACIDHGFTFSADSTYSRVPPGRIAGPASSRRS
jgi:hypothetical protein